MKARRSAGRRAAAVCAACLLIFTLLPCALAAPDVRRSTQNLSVNGRAADCEKYNIDGSNYFRLRDLAMLLRDTACSFSVGYDTESRTVAITAGEKYVPIGNELTAGEDQSATAQASRQTIRINGEAVGNLSVYNVGGSNFFMLRELAPYLGFGVDYDAATRTAKITAGAAAAPRSTLSDGSYEVHLDGTFEAVPGGALVGIRDAWADGAKTYTSCPGGKLFFPEDFRPEGYEEYQDPDAWREEFGIDPETFDWKSYAKTVPVRVVITRGAVTSLTVDFEP